MQTEPISKITNEKKDKALEILTQFSKECFNVQVRACKVCFKKTVTHLLLYTVANM
jgi:hypothetical protein